MAIIGTVDSLWRYPVKSMRGEEMDQLFVGFPGIYGDRLFAVLSSASHAGFPYLTGRDNRKMILYRPRFRDAGRAAAPINVTEALSLGSGVNPVSAKAEDLGLDVETPDGETLAIDDPALLDHLRTALDDGHHLTLHRSEKPMTDCRPVSIISLQTVQSLSQKAGTAVDKRCFRANIYFDLTNADGFAEDGLIGRKLRIGAKVGLSLLQRDGRCMMITLDPDTAEKNPAVLKTVAQDHEGQAGIYAAVLAEGMIVKGDSIEVLDS
jgi:uncharacterized protein YcbX